MKDGNSGLAKLASQEWLHSTGLITSAARIVRNGSTVVNSDLEAVEESACFMVLSHDPLEGLRFKVFSSRECKIGSVPLHKICCYGLICTVVRIYIVRHAPCYKKICVLGL